MILATFFCGVPLDLQDTERALQWTAAVLGDDVLRKVHKVAPRGHCGRPTRNIADGKRLMDQLGLAAVAHVCV